MKKSSKFIIFSVFLLFIGVFSVLLSPQKNVFADTDFTSIELKCFQTSSSTQLDEPYTIEFNGNTAESPYNSFEFRLYVDNVYFFDLEPSVKSQILSSIQLYVNNSPIDNLGLNSLLEDENYKINFDITNFKGIYTPKKPGEHLLKVQLDSLVNEKSITVESAGLNDILVDFFIGGFSIIETSNKKIVNIDYDSFEQITIVAQISNSQYFSSSFISDLTFSWNVNNFNMFDISGNQLTITKSDITVTGETECWFKIFSSDGETSRNVFINIQSNSAVLTITSNTDNILQAGTGKISTELHASLLISQPYSITWYKKTPNSTSYKKIFLNVSNDRYYNFSLNNENPGKNGYGEYKIIAVAETLTQPIIKYVSSATVITVKPAEVSSTTLYDVIVENTANSKSSIQAYKLTLISSDASLNDLDASKIIWFVVGPQQPESVLGYGTTIVLEPQIAGEYRVDVKLLDTSTNSVTNLLSSGAKKIVANFNQGLKIAMYCLIVLGTLSIILVISIKVTTKKRELIW